MMTRLGCLLLALALAGSLSGCGSSGPAEGQTFAMDTVMNFSAYGKTGEDAITAARERIYQLEAELSRTREDSEVSQLNQAGGEMTAVGDDVWKLLTSAKTYSAATGDAFDITVAPVVSAWGFTTDTYQVPSQEELDTLLQLVDDSRIQLEQRSDGCYAALGQGQSIDLGGIAKGYASDCVAEIFAQYGVESGMISLGGNVYVSGAKPDGSAWRVGVQDPQDSSAAVGILDLTDAYAVTSGGYQRYFEQDGKRYHHIIDPATGYPAESGLLQVTVVAGADAAREDDGNPAGTGTMCDAFSTALFVMGEEKALDFWRSGAYEFDLILVTDDGRVLVTDGLADRFTPMDGSEYSYETVS